jgi:glycosyltransferase involved in cell wall biosynthesis
LIRVVHVITGLEVGGAEISLLKLVSNLSKDRFFNQVISLTDAGSVAKRLRDVDVKVSALRMHRGSINPIAVWKLAHLLRRTHPTIVQTWMYHADLIGGLAAKLAGRYPVIWNIRQSNLDPVHSKRTTVWTAKACARLSRYLPERIVCCAESARRIHVDLGYAGERMVVIPNGIGADIFKPDSHARATMRAEISIDERTILIGLVARFDPQKDHETFVRAAGMLYKEFPDARFLLCGPGVTRENKQLMRWLQSNGIADHCHVLGEREDIPRLMTALDIATSSSAYGEGFPNAIGEAMACGVPCVVTDVGDSSLLVGDPDRVVPPRQPESLAAAWRRLLAMDKAGRAQVGRAGRRRMEDQFDIVAITRRYEELYEQVAGVWG